MACCPLCGAACDPRILAQAAGLAAAVARRVQRTHPSWQRAHGLCPACAARFAQEIAAERDDGSLHTLTDPPTTFPYYHPDEETVLGQPERLPGYTPLGGDGITVAFLDSGYYPHPDLTQQPLWPDAPDWPRLNAQEMRGVLAAADLRLRHYVDLTDDGQQEGLDVASLWDAAGDSWHGQMTTTLALGNGLLSAGRYAGYAPRAGLLPIKIGRGGGRIPEEDILRGLNWLLEDDRWQRYGVRVLNVSVGGDFLEPWEANPVCQAAEELIRRGVLIAAAAGNRGVAQLVAPAQAPNVLTVGGVDDLNRLWSPTVAAEVGRLALYPHNWGKVRTAEGVMRKPELLALARWLPAPVLPPTPVFQEMHAIDRLRATLLADGGHLDELAAHWVQALHSDPVYRKRHPEQSPDDWRAEMWSALRKRMNAHKWIHAYYQHVDGTSVAVAQVSAVAAQMVQANPALTPGQIKTLLMQTALPLRHLPRLRSGAGMLQPGRAVAAALRASGGPLQDIPLSGTSPRARPDAPTWGEGERAVYVGLFAPDATHVSVIGSFNGWQPGCTPLARTDAGWWHGVLCLPKQRHAYRFWVEGGVYGTGAWLPDPEQQPQIESGYGAGHSLLDLAEPSAPDPPLGQ